MQSLGRRGVWSFRILKQFILTAAQQRRRGEHEHNTAAATLL